MQARDSGLGIGPIEHAPPTQRCAEQPRYCVPLPEHALVALAAGKHTVQSPHVSALHAVPSVSRVHACVSVVIVVAPQAPPEQIAVVTVRDCVPVVSQVSLKPPQGPQGPAEGAAQAIPSVARAQPAVSTSTVVDVVHMPPLHTPLLTVRVREPLVAQPLA